MIAVGRQRAVRFLCGLPSAGRLGALSADRQALREKRNPRNSAGQASAADLQFCGASTQPPCQEPVPKNYGRELPQLRLCTIRRGGRISTGN